MIKNRTQRRISERARAEILRDAAQRVNECAFEFWWESSYPLYALCAIILLKMIARWYEVGPVSTHIVEDVIVFDVAQKQFLKW